MSQKRLTAQSQVSADGGPWQAAGSYSELTAPPPAMPAMQPMAGVPQPMGGNPTAAQSMVTGPAISLLCVGIIGLIGVLLSSIMELGRIGRGTSVLNQGGTPEIMGYYLGYALQIVVQIIIIIGAIRMRQLRSRGLVMTVCILSVIPICSSCIVLGIPFGIWGLVVITKPEVKAAFH